MHADYGRITDVLFTGKVGASATARSSITAGVRVDRVSARTEGGTTVLAAPVYADLHFGTRDVASPLLGRKSSFSLVETEGDFTGSISVFDFDADVDPFGPSTPEGRKGIFVGGKFQGDINVTYSWVNGDMVARSFRGTINVRQLFRGSIVAVGYDPTEPGYSATDTLDGTLGNVFIGFNADGSDVPMNGDPEDFPIALSPRPDRLPGFCGNIGIIPPPFEGADRVNWYTNTPIEGGTVDSVIRAARSAADIRARAMSHRLDELKPANTRPRVESPEIGNLRVDFFDFGSIWSGRLNSTATTVTNEIADDYASITALNIGCIGPRADLWVKGCDVVDIHGDMFGAIHLPELKSHEVVRIAGRFGDVFQAEHGPPSLCGTDLENAESPFDRFAPVEPDEPHSPRGFWADDFNATPIDHDSDTYLMDPAHPEKDRPRRSAILIRKPDAFRGQVILDAENSRSPLHPRPRDYGNTDTESLDDGAYWLGTVETGTGLHVDFNVPEVPTILSTFEHLATSADYWAQFAPDGSQRLAYAAHAWTMGGGAVGMVPFDLYHADCFPESLCIFDDGCTPVYGDPTPVPVISADTFEIDGIGLTFFGPVELDITPNNQHVSLFLCDAWGVPNRAADYGDEDTVAVPIQTNTAAPFSRIAG